MGCMNINALLDKLAADLTTTHGHVTHESGGLAFKGCTFARLKEEGMSFLLGADSPARESALGREQARSDAPGWVYSSAADVSQWPILAEQALSALRRS